MDYRKYLSFIPRPSDAKSVGIELDEILNAQFENSKKSSQFNYKNNSSQGSSRSSNHHSSKYNSSSRHFKTEDDDDEDDDDFQSFYEV